MSQRAIEPLSKVECFDLLGQAVVGRLVFLDGEGLGAVPVNYGLAGEAIVFRVAQDSGLRDVLQGQIAFEVDRVDPEAGAGWSVLVRGTGREIDTDDLPALMKQLRTHAPRPWAKGVHNVWIAITAMQVTGRRLTEPYFSAIY